MRVLHVRVVWLSWPSAITLCARRPLVGSTAPRPPSPILTYFKAFVFPAQLSTGQSSIYVHLQKVLTRIFSWKQKGQKMFAFHLYREEIKYFSIKESCGVVWGRVWASGPSLVYFEEKGVAFLVAKQFWSNLGNFHFILEAFLQYFRAGVFLINFWRWGIIPVCIWVRDISTAFWREGLWVSFLRKAICSILQTFIFRVWGASYFFPGGISSRYTFFFGWKTITFLGKRIGFILK